VPAPLDAEADHLRRPEQTPPEIERLDLAEMRLLLAVAGCGEDLALPQPPPDEAWERAGRVLRELGAVDKKGVTELGRAMARLPLHPRYARLLLAAEQEGCLDGMAAALALLEAGPLRERRVDKAVERQWAEWTAAAEGFSDLLRDVLLWQKAAAAEEGVGDFCRKWRLRAGSVHQASRVYRQLRGLLGKESRPTEDLPRAFARSLLTGFADHLGLRRRGTRSCLLCHGRRGEVEAETVVDGEGLFLALDLEERAVRGEVKVRAAGLTRVEEGWLEELFPGEAAVEECEVLDAERRAIVRRRRRSFRGLLLRDEESGEPDPARAATLLAEGLHRHGWPLKKWDAAAETWLRRADLLARLFPEWNLSPIREEDRLLLLEQICEGAIRYKEVKDRPVMPVLRAWLPSGMEAVMDRLLPERFPLPGTRGLKLRYEEDGTVVLPARAHPATVRRSRQKPDRRRRTPVPATGNPRPEPASGAHHRRPRRFLGGRLSANPQGPLRTLPQA
jgi:ATP-dependent helicase HrpB